MYRTEITLDIAGKCIKCYSDHADEYDFYEEQSKAASATPLRPLIEIIKARAGDTLGRMHKKTPADNSTTNSTLASILFRDDVTYLWDETNFTYVDIRKGERHVVIFYLITVRATDRETVRRACEPILQRYGLSVTEIEPAAEGLASSFDEEGDRSWKITSLGELSSFTVGDINLMRRSLSYSAFFPDRTSIHPELVIHMLKTGSAVKLIETPETQWLEAKACAYEDRPAPQWKIELAQDVASFANAESGGILIIGMQTKTDPNRKDIIRRVTPVPINKTRLQTYAQVIKEYVYPPIDNIQFDSVRVGKGEIVYIYIPTQQEGRKPYIVQGDIINGKLVPYVFSVPRRQGDGKIWLRGQEFYNMLAVGRAVLRTGEILDRPE